jgi:hypothetical protein
MSERFDIDIFAYVLMDTHYHLLLRPQKAIYPEAYSGWVQPIPADLI